MQEYFFDLCEKIHSLLRPEEYLASYLSAEESDFCRLNYSKIRQLGSVKQAYIHVHLVVNQRTAKMSFAISYDQDRDFQEWKKHLDYLRALVAILPKDPYAVVKNEVTNSFDRHDQDLPHAAEMIDGLTDACSSYELVGIFVSGKMMRGFANSFGQRNWFEVSNFNCDWSVYSSSGKAVKNSYAGNQWSLETLRAKLDQDKSMHELLSIPAISLKPGAYRVYLAPAAMMEIFELLNWNAFGAKSQKTKSSSLGRLYEGEGSLASMITLKEGFSHAASPMFNETGYLRPESLDLIVNGRAAHSLISPQTAIEYGLTTNGAGMSESPQALHLGGGDMQQQDILKHIDHGLYISNLWYLNFSDLDACKMTGMTRFACFQVKNGQLQEPINAMRFDESLYRMLGGNLEALTSEPEILMSSGSYGQRSSLAMNLPGALMNDFSLTL